MDQRVEDRDERVLPVEIWHRGHRVGGFRTRNLSPSGMCIETGETAICVNDFVQLLLWTAEGPRELMGLVVRVDDGAIGVACHARMPAAWIVRPGTVVFPPPGLWLRGSAPTSRRAMAGAMRG
jgi:hypothetical protein